MNTKDDNRENKEVRRAEVFQLSISFYNSNPDTVWNKLAARLGREPSRKEAAEEVRRILSEAHR